MYGLGTAGSNNCEVKLTHVNLPPVTNPSASEESPRFSRNCSTMQRPPRENSSAYSTAFRSPSGPSTREQPFEPAASTGLAITG